MDQTSRRYKRSCSSPPGNDDWRRKRQKFQQEINIESGLSSRAEIPNPNQIIPMKTNEESQIEEHRCRLCLQTFPTFSKLQDHETLHHRVLLCLACNRKYSSHRLFNRHVANAHRHLGSFICSHCDFRTLVQSEWIKHLRTHIQPLMIDWARGGCPLCDFSTCTEPHPQILVLRLFEHLRVAHNFYSCPGCGQLEISETLLLCHVNAAHKVFCSNCPGEVDSIESFVLHCTVCPQMVLLPFKCPNRTCTFSGEDVEALLGHLEQIHSEFYCTLCATYAPPPEIRAGYGREYLARHVQRHVLNGEIFCTLCDWRGRKVAYEHTQLHNEDANVHKAIAEGWKRIPWGAQASSVRKMKIRAGCFVLKGLAKVKGGRLVCKFCPDPLGHRFSRHLIDSHQIYACVGCSSVFRNENELSGHCLLKHRKEDHFICPYCAFTFEMSQNWQEHVEMHLPRDEEKTKN